MSTVTSIPGAKSVAAIPRTMTAAVYRGVDDVRVESISVPEIGPGELLVRIHTCGICGTDLKKIHTGSHSAPRIFGHEMAGTVAKVGDGVAGFAPGDRVMVFHHIPCGECYYCRCKVFAQCPIYKKVGATAGFEPAGGGFAEYIRVMDWIVRRGVVKIPDDVSFEQASFLEPVNTCWKGIQGLRLQSGETVLVVGAGPIGVILAALAHRVGARVIASDLFPERLARARAYGVEEAIEAGRTDMVVRTRDLTGGRGADAVIVAVAGDGLVPVALEATRPGGRVMLFASTQRSQVAIDPAAICMDEKTLMGSYSASVDLQAETAGLVFKGGIDFAGLISHRFALSEAAQAIRLASHPEPGSMKIVFQSAG
jgi:L-iditol 2-dehydrogenase